MKILDKKQDSIYKTLNSNYYQHKLKEVKK